MMETRPPKGASAGGTSSLPDLFSLPSQALDLYFGMTTQETAMTQEELVKLHHMSEGKLRELLTQLEARGLVRHNPDKTYEGVAPIEAVAMSLTAVRDTLQGLQQNLPGQLETGIPPVAEDVRQIVEEFAKNLAELRAAIDGPVIELLDEFSEKASNLRSAPAFGEFVDKLQTKLVHEVDKRMSEVRGDLDKFESLEAFTRVLEKLKNDVFAIVNISLSDMREKAFRLHELQEFREDLVELWQVTPSIVGEHLTTFEQEMSTLEASLGDLFETKYRLGALKGVMENFTREHIMTSVKTLKANFQRSLTEAIQDHLEKVQQRFDKVSVLALQEFEQLRNQIAAWIKNALDIAFGEVTRRNQEAATSLATKLEGLTVSFQEEFSGGLQETVTKVKANAKELDSQLTRLNANVTRLHSEKMTPKIDQIARRTENQIARLASLLPKSFEQWRAHYLESVEKQLSVTLQEAQARVRLAVEGVDQFWRRSKVAQPTPFKLYHFVEGQPDFQGELTSIVPRARRNLLLVLPRSVPACAELLRLVPSKVQARVVVADAPQSLEFEALRKAISGLSNIQVRFDERTDLWGVLRDSEELLLGSTARGLTQVTGIASNHEDQVELLRPLLETRWLHGHPVPTH
jgi:DNA-binding GntR family transcriptional regulator